MEPNQNTPAAEPTVDPELTHNLDDLLTGLSASEEGGEPVDNDEPEVPDDEGDGEEEPAGNDDADGDADDYDEGLEDADEDGAEGGGEEEDGGDGPEDDVEEEGSGSGKKWTLKAHGKTREITEEKELVSLAQQGLAATQKFQKASEKLKEADAKGQQAEYVLSEVAKDPLGSFLRMAAKEVGYAKAQEILNNHVAQYVQPRIQHVEQGTLDQYDRERELEWREQELRRQEEAAKTARSEKDAERTLKQLEASVKPALEKAGLPDTRTIHLRMIRKLRQQGELGIPLDAEEAAQEIALEDRGAVAPGQKSDADDLTAEDRKKLGKIQKDNIRRVKDKRRQKRTTPRKDGKPTRRGRSKQAQQAEESLGDFFANVHRDLYST